jgi:uncharacterized protein (TIGR02246 family)
MQSTTQSSAGPSTPEELMARFTEYVHARKLDDLIALYEPEAVFIPEPGVVHVGREAIRSALGQMLGLSPRMETRIESVDVASNTALVVVDWSLRGTAPDGSPVTQSGHSADVLRRQPDGTWRVLIDHP